MVFKRNIYRDDLFPCALCEDAPCTKACGKMDCASMLRSAWFDNEQGAARALPGQFPCNGCPSRCERACVFPGQVRIKKTMQMLAEIRDDLDVKEKPDLKNLRVTFAGFSLINPFILDAPDASDTQEKCLHAFQAGFGGVILPVVTQQQAKRSGHVSPRFGSVKAGGTVFGMIDIGCGDGAGMPVQAGDAQAVSGASGPEDETGLPGCLSFIPALKRSFPERMVIPTYREGQGTDLADFQMLAVRAGADALLLDCDYGPLPQAQQTERIRDCLKALKDQDARKLPLILRFNASGHVPEEILSITGEYGIDVLAPQFDGGGILSFNRHNYAPAPSVRGRSAIGRTGGTITKPAALAGQACLARLFDSRAVQFFSGAAVECWSDGLDFILLGATALRVSDAVLQYGLRIINDLTDGFSSYLEEKNYTDAGQLTGLAVSNLVQPDELDKDAVLYPGISRNRCIGCGRCTLACKECAADALQEGMDHVPMLIANRCTGCHLCTQICPVGAITPANRRG